MLCGHQSAVAGFLGQPLNDDLPELQVYASQAVVAIGVVGMGLESPVILLDGAVVLFQADQSGDIKLPRFPLVWLYLHCFAQQSERFGVPALLKANLAPKKMGHEKIWSELQGMR